MKRDARYQSSVAGKGGGAELNERERDRFSKTPRRQVSWHLRLERQCRIAAATSKRLVKQALNDCSYLDIESVLVKHDEEVTERPREKEVEARGRKDPEVVARASWLRGGPAC